MRNTLETSGCGLRGSGPHRTLGANPQAGIDSSSVPRPLLPTAENSLFLARVADWLSGRLGISYVKLGGRNEGERIHHAIGKEGASPLYPGWRRVPGRG